MNQTSHHEYGRNSGLSGPLLKTGLLRPLFVAALFLLLIASPGRAQELSVEQVMENLAERARGLTDARSLVTGRIKDSDGSVYELELDLQFIPGDKLFRADIYRPEALADNFIIVDNQTVYNYLFVTNQVSILNAADPDALASLMSAASLEDGEDIDLSLDLNRLFEGWDVRILWYGNQDIGWIYRLRFDNRDELADIGYAITEVTRRRWDPYKISLYRTTGGAEANSTGVLVTELVFTDFRSDLGLDPEDLLDLPPDAEIIDNR